MTDPWLVLYTLSLIGAAVWLAVDIWRRRDDG